MMAGLFAYVRSAKNIKQSTLIEWTGPRFTGHLSGFGCGLDEPAPGLVGGNSFQVEKPLPNNAKETLYGLTPTQKGHSGDEVQEGHEMPYMGLPRGRNCRTVNLAAPHPALRKSLRTRSTAAGLNL